MCTEDPDSSATKQLIGKDLPCKDTPLLGRVATALGGKLVLAAALTGWLAERRWDRRFLGAAVAMTAGALVVRLRGQVLCRVTTHPVGRVPAATGTE